MGKRVLSALTSKQAKDHPLLDGSPSSIVNASGIDPEQNPLRYGECQPLSHHFTSVVGTIGSITTRRGDPTSKSYFCTVHTLDHPVKGQCKQTTFSFQTNDDSYTKIVIAETQGCT